MLQTIAIAVANHRFFVSMCRTRFKSFRRLVVCSGFPVSTAILVAICIRRVSKRKDHNSPKFNTKTFHRLCTWFHCRCAAYFAAYFGSPILIHTYHQHIVCQCWCVCAIYPSPRLYRSHCLGMCVCALNPLF